MDNDVKRVKCPHCHAERGTECVSPQRRVAEAGHAARHHRLRWMLDNPVVEVRADGTPLSYP